MFARVVLDHYAQKEFDYRIPPELAGAVVPGARVEVPFGKTRKSATVVSLQTHPSVEESRIKDIHALSGGCALLDERMMELLRWMHRYYGSAMGKVIQCAVPAAVRLPRVREAVSEWVDKAAGFPQQVTGRSRWERILHEELARSSSQVELKTLLNSTGADRQVLKRMEKRDWLRIVEKPVIRMVDAKSPIVFAAPRPVLNERQRQAVDALCRQLEEGFRCVLLYGVTGSGKTEVYLRVIEKALQQGRSALVLVPEISLTPQTIDRFRSRFDQPLAILHSGLSDGQRFDQWKLIRDGKARIVIGARSAVFAPLSNLGVIIVDEEQERSFKQQEAPHYHARDVAVVRAKLENALIVLVSATPSLETYHNAVRGKYELLELPERVDQRAMPRIEILDMRLESARSGKVPLISGRLAAMIQARLDHGQQVMLMLNRRGYHRCLWCPCCGQSLTCPHCSVTLSYHRVGGHLLCHLCGHKQALTTRCPGCSHDMLLPQGSGTQKVEALLRKLFPGARVARMDSDTTRGRGSHRDILSRFALGHYDILVGTQMIAKGHDFPNVTLVGILNADMGMNIPDFRAAEQTYHLLTQVSGRAGRGITGGEVVVQTHMPDHFLMGAVKAGDFKKFYEREIALRNELDYPPKVHLVLVGIKQAGEEKAREAAAILHRQMQLLLKDTAAVFPPAEAPIQKAKGMYRWQILLKTRSMVRTQEKLEALMQTLRLPHGTQVDIDADPQVLA